MSNFHGFPAVVCQAEIGLADRILILNPSIYIFEGFVANLLGQKFLRSKLTGKIPLLIINLRTATIEAHWLHEFQVIKDFQIDWTQLGQEFADAQ